MKRVIVTGATGFIGSKLVKELVGNGIEVIVIVRDRKAKEQHLKSLGNIKIVECEMKCINDLKKYIEYGSIDVFLHLAWEGAAGEFRSDYVLQLANIEYTINALKTASILGCKKFVGIGSLMEFELNYLMKNNKDLIPNNIYNVSKYTAHVMTKAIASNLNLEYVWTYITNAYGEDEVSPRFFNSTLKKMINKECLEFTLADNLYDFVHVEDVARAIYLIGKHGKNGSNYCIGSGMPRLLKDYIISMSNIAENKLQLNFGKIPSNMIYLNKEIYSIDNTTKDTGYTPQITFEEGVNRALKTIKNNLEGYCGKI